MVQYGIGSKQTGEMMVWLRECSDHARDLHWACLLVSCRHIHKCLNRAPLALGRPKNKTHKMCHVLLFFIYIIEPYWFLYPTICQQSREHCIAMLGVFPSILGMCWSLIWSDHFLSSVFIHSWLKSGVHVCCCTLDMICWFLLSFAKSECLFLSAWYWQ